MNVEQIVQENLDAYNARDIDAFMASFDEDVEMYIFNSKEPWAKGLADVRKYYDALFQSSPNLFSKIIKRIVFDNKVIDHESITEREGRSEVVEMVLIYEVENEKIQKITAIK